MVRCIALDLQLYFLDNSIEAIEKARKTAYSNALLFNGNADVQLLPVAPSEEFGHIQKMVEKLTFSSYPAALSVTSAMRVFHIFAHNNFNRYLIPCCGDAFGILLRNYFFLTSLLNKDSLQ